MIHVVVEEDVLRRMASRKLRLGASVLAEGG